MIRIKKNVMFTLFAVALFANAAAQTTFQQAYNAFRQQAKDDYEDFRQKANHEYAEWMSQAWEWKDIVPAVPMPEEEEKPPIIYDKKEGKKEETKPLPFDGMVTTPEPEPQPKPVAPIREIDGDYEWMNFEFYGTEGKVRMPNNSKFKIHKSETHEEAYAQAWEELSSEQYNNLIRDCLLLRIEHQLCDWAYLMMLGEMSNAICGKGTNEAAMLQAFVFCQSGYKIRLGFTKNHDLRILFKSEHLIYKLPGFNMKDGLYYLLQPIEEGDGLSVCDISYPEERPLSLWIPEEQLLTERMSEERWFVPQDSVIGIRVQTNENWIKFCGSYPTSMMGEDVMSRWAMYANTPMSAKVKEKLYPQLRYVIEQLGDTLKAADWLLYWIQTAFVYEYDDKVWGNDRAFFAEETLYYPYCDCEDRAILYTRLVRDLLGLDCILVYYPGHLASAVCFLNPVEGDYIDIDGRHFTICDPTYIGAPIGATMPDMDNQTAKVILLK